MLSEMTWGDWAGLALVVSAPTLIVSMAFLRVALRLVAMIREQQAAILSLAEKPAANALAMAMERTTREQLAVENGDPAARPRVRSIA